MTWGRFGWMFFFYCHRFRDTSLTHRLLMEWFCWGVVQPGVWPTFAASHNLAADTVLESGAIRQHLQNLVDEVNARFARVEHVRKFSVLPRVLTVDDGELTPTLKVKRRIVAENWSDTIEAMYQD